MTDFPQPIVLRASAVPVAIPNAVGLFTWGATANSVNIQCSAPPTAAANSVIAFSAQYARFCDFATTTVSLGTRTLNPSTNASFTFNGLTANTSYKFRITINGGRYTPWVQGTTLANGATDSPDGTVVNLPTFGSIIGSGPHTWTLVEQDLPFGVAVDGTADGVGSEIIMMIYSGGGVYFQNKDYVWKAKTLPTDAYQVASDPRLGAPPHGQLPVSYVTMESPTSTTTNLRYAAASYLGGALLDACKMTLVFWGSDWSNQAVTSDVILAKIQTLCAGPYYSGLQELLIANKPTVASSISYTGTNPPTFGAQDPTTIFPPLITSLFDAGTLAAPTTENHLIVVVNPVSAKNANGLGGAHGSFFYQGNLIQYAFIFGFIDGAYLTRVTLDAYTTTIAHESVEAITDPHNGFIASSAPSNAPAPLLSWAVAGEASTLTTISGQEEEDFANTDVPAGTVVGGINVAGYFSNRARALIAPTADPPLFNTNGGPVGLFTNPGSISTTNMTWTAPTGTPNGTVVTYGVQYKRLIDHNWITLPSFTSNQATVNFTVPNLAINSSFIFRVQANGSRYCPPYGGNTTKGTFTDEYDGNHLTGTTGSLTGVDGTLYSLLETVSLPYHVGQNGTDDGISSEVIRLVYHQRKIHQQNKDYNWWSKSLIGDTWTQTTNPCLNALPVGNLPANYSVRDQPTGTVMTPRGGAIISTDPRVYFIYWGDFWNTAPAPTSADITAAMRTSYSGAYFSGLQEYGVFAKPVLVNTYIVPGTPPSLAIPDTNPTLQTLLGGLWDAGTIPIPTSDNVLYMVISPPASGAPTNIGAYHSHILYRDLTVPAGFCFYPGSGGQTTLDQYTIGLTHETSEWATDPFLDYLSGFYGPGDGSTPGNILAGENNDFGNQTQLVTNGIAQMGFYSNRLRAVIIPTTDTAFPPLP